jgi:Zn-dependent protease
VPDALILPILRVPGYYLGFAFAALTPVDAREIFSVAAVTILASVVLHGVSSAVLTRRLLAGESPG